MSGCIPAVVKRTVGSFSGIREAEGIIVCPLSLKKRRKSARSSVVVNDFILFVNLSPLAGLDCLMSGFVPNNLFSQKLNSAAALGKSRFRNTRNARIGFGQAAVKAGAFTKGMFRINQRLPNYTLYCQHACSCQCASLLI